MALIICGHERSGTTLLRNLCHAHPDIIMTMEFNNFAKIDRSFSEYSRFILKRWNSQKYRSFLVQGKEEEKISNVLQSHLFVTRYLFEIFKAQDPPFSKRSKVRVSTIESSLKKIFPTAKIVGDKMTMYYVYRLEELTSQDNISIVVLYRDCRSVVSSTLEKVRGDWKNFSFIKKLDTPEKIAKRWVESITLIEKYSEKLHIIRYEDLVSHPYEELNRLSKYIGINVDGFPIEKIHQSSLEKYKSTLTEEELEKISKIAGMKLKELSYS